MAVREDESGRLWAGTLGGGLYRLDRQGGEPVHYRHRSGDPTSLPSDVVWAIHKDQEGRLWVGDGGLSRFDRRTGAFRRYPLPFSDPQAPSHPAVHVIREGRGGALWIGSSRGLYRVVPTSGRVERRLALRRIWTLRVSPHGPIWIGTEGKGLLRYAPDSDSLTAYPIAVADTAGLTGQTVWSIHEDERGRLWLGTDLGLSRFDPDAGTFRHIYDPDEWPGAVVYSIREDERGWLWLGTNQGLVRFNPATRAVRHYDRGDGLGNEEFNRGAAFRNEQGELFFGGLSGITAFDPSAIRPDPHVPPVALTQMQIFSGGNRRTLPAGTLGNGPLVLDHREATFELTFAALSFTRPEENQYAYRLEGFDDDWVEAGTRRVARYTNVPPGEYVFRVKGSNGDGVWNEDGARLRIRITPPFWQTWWFYLIVLGVVVGLLAAAYRYRVATLLEMERMRLRIASDLHDDVGSTLSSMALTSEMVRDEAELTERQQARLSKISRAAREMVGTLRDIVWFVNPEHDAPGALVQKMEDVASTLLQDVAYTFTCSDRISLEEAGIERRRTIFLIYKEALHNVARHAQAEAVEIRMERDRDLLHLTVTDDGVGFDPASAPTGNGLESMARRAEQIGAELTVESTPGGGTTVELVAKMA